MEPVAKEPIDMAAKFEAAKVAEHDLAEAKEKGGDVIKKITDLVKKNKALGSDERATTVKQLAALRVELMSTKSPEDILRLTNKINKQGLVILAAVSKDTSEGFNLALGDELALAVGSAEKAEKAISEYRDAVYNQLESLVAKWEHEESWEEKVGPHVHTLLEGSIEEAERTRVELQILDKSKEYIKDKINDLNTVKTSLEGYRAGKLFPGRMLESFLGSSITQLKKFKQDLKPVRKFSGKAFIQAIRKHQLKFEALMAKLLVGIGKFVSDFVYLFEFYSPP